MKSIGFTFCCLLFAVAATEDEVPQAVEETTPQPIAFKYFTVNDSSYALGLYSKVNWYRAELICESQDYILVSIPSEDVKIDIVNWIKSEAYDYFHLLNTETLWTSGTNQAISSEYLWQSTGEYVNYNNFEIDPPTTTKRCIGINGTNGKWYDHDCREQHYFMCQKVTRNAKC